MKKTVLIVPYFGPFPNYFPLFLRSCGHNPNVDWLFVTDNELKTPYPNIHVLPWSFEQLKEQIAERLSVNESIPAPYKLCDYRPAYGHIFEEYIQAYDFWGHCDVDLIYGDLEFFLVDAPWEDYDRLFTFGHLTLYRNTKQVNRYYQLEGEKDNSFYYCIQFPEPMYFDEGGMNRLLDQHRIPQYHHPTFADIWPQTPHFKNRLFYTDKNYKDQYFTWEDGKVFKNWQEQGRTHQQEYSYIHLQKRAFPQPDENLLEANSFAITPHGFYHINHPNFPQKLKPNYEHAYRYYKKRYSNVTPKKVTRKIQAIFYSNP